MYGSDHDVGVDPAPFQPYREIQQILLGATPACAFFIEDDPRNARGEARALSHLAGLLAGPHPICVGTGGNVSS
jgi:hypothetical protein